MGKKVLIMTDDMRSANSGFSMEGTDLTFDFPDQFPVPNECLVMENGVLVHLRALPQTDVLEKKKQMEMGFPDYIPISDAIEKNLTFHFARIELDENSHWFKYLKRACWMAGNEMKKTRSNDRTMYEEYDEDALDIEKLNELELVDEARKAIRALDDAGVRNLYMLATNGSAINTLVSVGKQKLHLYEIADANPAFILDGIKDERDEAIVLVQKAIEYKIISLEFQGQVAIFSKAEDDFVQMFEMPAVGQTKFEKTVDYLLTKEGQINLKIIADRVRKHEAGIAEELED